MLADERATDLQVLRSQTVGVLIELVREYMQRQSVHRPPGLDPRLAVDHNSRQTRNLRDLASVVLLFEFDVKR
jgi:hypothetical protein